MQNILVLFGGDSVESDVSIITASMVLNSISMDKYNVYPVYIRDNEWWWLKQDMAVEMSTYIDDNYAKVGKKVVLSNGILYIKGRYIIRKLSRINTVLLATHGGSGENGALQGLLKMNNLPYTSSGVLPSGVCMDKDLTHKLTKLLGLQTVDYEVVTADTEIEKIEEIFDKLGGNVVVKPNSLGSSIGVKRVDNIKDLHSSLSNGFRYDEKIIIERAVENLIELNCAVVDDKEGIIVSPVDIVTPHNGVYDFEEKYINSVAEKTKITLPDNIINSVKNMSRIIYENFGLAGVVRIDYLFDSEREQLYINEVNTIPGSLAYYLFASVGIDMTELIDILLESANARLNDENRLVHRFSSSILTVRKNSGAKLLQKIHK